MSGDISIMYVVSLFAMPLGLIALGVAIADVRDWWGLTRLGVVFVAWSLGMLASVMLIKFGTPMFALTCLIVGLALTVAAVTIRFAFRAGGSR